MKTWFNQSRQYQSNAFLEVLEKPTYLTDRGEEGTVVYETLLIALKMLKNVLCVSCKINFMNVNH